MNNLLRNTSAIALFIILAIIAVATHLTNVFALHIIGSACGLGALILLYQFCAARYPFFHGQVSVGKRSFDLESSARRILPASVVLLASLVVLAPLLRGQMPLSHDHPVHLYKAWHFWEEMLLNGRLRGWSSYWFFGYPAEELYPIGPDLWVAFFRLITLGLLSWEATYGIAFIAVFAFAAYAVYSFGKRHFSTGAGIFAALLWIFDMGDYREGGWSYTVDWAVWVQVMAMGFLLLAFGRLKAALDDRRPRNFAIAGLLFGAVFLSHQMNFLLCAIGLPLWLLCRVLTSRQRRFGQEIVALGSIVALGVLLAGFYAIPMLTRSAWTSDIGDLWRPFNDTVSGLLTGTVFSEVWPLPIFLGLVGAALGIAQRRSAALFLLLLGAVLLFLCSSTAFEELKLMLVSKSFAKIQYQRFVIPAKACLYLLAGLAFSELWRRAQAMRLASKESLDQQEGKPALAAKWRPWILTALIVLILAPFVRPAFELYGNKYVRTIGGLTLKNKVPYWADYKDFLKWSDQQRKESQDFYRISYELERHNHMMMGAPAYNHTPYYKIGYTPARLFKNAPETTEDPLYRALSVKYIVSLGPLNRPNLALEQRFGSIWVYRFTEYRKERYTISGPGQAEVLEFSEEKIRFRLSNTSTQSRLKVHVSNYPRWQARLNGQTAQISEAPVYDQSYPMLMEVPISDGILEFRYVSRWPDVLGAIATLLSMALVVLLFLHPRQPKIIKSLLDRLALEKPIAWLNRWAGWAALLVAILGLGLIGFRLARGGAAGLEDDSLFKNLSQAQVSMGGQPCSTWRQGSWFCSDRAWNYIGPTTATFNGGMMSCIWAHPVDEGPLEVRFPRQVIGTGINGHHGLADSGATGFPEGTPVNLEILIDGQTVETLVRPNQRGWMNFRVNTNQWAGREAEVMLRVSSQRSAGRHYCLDMHWER